MSVLEERQNTHYIIISIYSLVYLSAWTIKVNTLVQPFSHQITVTYSPGQKVCRESPGHLQPPWPQPADELPQKGDCWNFRMSKEFLPPASRVVLERTEAIIANLLQRFYYPVSSNNAMFGWNVEGRQNRVGACHLKKSFRAPGIKP